MFKKILYGIVFTWVFMTGCYSNNFMVYNIMIENIAQWIQIASLYSTLRNKLKSLRLHMALIYKS